MIYKAYLIQQGEGCDYTIGCAQTVIKIEATNLDEAKAKLKEIILEEYNDDETQLEKVELYEIATLTEINIKQIYKKAKDIENEEAEKEKEAEEKELLKKLKQKYES